MVRSPRANIDKQYKGYAMRRSYMINSHKCHFFEGDDDVHHDVEDLFNLLKLPQEARREILRRWWLRFDICRPASGVGKVRLMLSEIYLKYFLRDAIATFNGNSAVSEHSLFKRIIQGRLDAIVENYSLHLIHPDQAVRSELQERARSIFGSFYVCMETFAKTEVLSPKHRTEWKRVKKLLPAEMSLINDRSVFALVILLAPIWPRSIDVKGDSEFMADYVYLTAFVAECRLAGITNSERAMGVQRSLLKRGLKHKSHKREDDQPEP